MMFMFADDTKISCTVSGESLLLQQLESLMEWSKYGHLDFNVDKCKTMRVGHCYLTEYKLYGNKLQEVEEKDLGITVTNNLKPSVQCAKAAAKGMQVLGVIKRNFVLKDKIFDYCLMDFFDPIWNIVCLSGRLISEKN